MVYKRICKQCNIDFESTNKNAKFCSQKCFGKWRTKNFCGDNNPIRKQREIRKCINCNSEFECRVDSNKKYCNHKCYWEDMKGKELKDKTEFICQICKKSFYKTNKNDSQKFCSRECYLIDHSKNIRIEKCFMCNKEFMISRINKDNKYFCSRECYLEDHASIMVEFTCPVCDKTFKQSEGLSEKKLCCSKDCAMKYVNTNEDRNRKISETISKKYADGEMDSTATYNSGYYLSKKNNKKLHYRSSYELMAYKILEQMSKVKFYEVEPFAIPYTYRGIIRHTIPDILVTYTDNTKELIEVKPNYMLEDHQTNTKINRMKFYAGRKGWEFSVWTENRLGLCN